MPYRLLERFRHTFEGQKYLHRSSKLGDVIASELSEDLFALGASSAFTARIRERSRVLNRDNRRRGIVARRGDGTFGERVPNAEVLLEDGFRVARGQIATVEVGVEVKILSKAMLKQIGRVTTVLRDQVEEFRRGGGNPICVGIVGINAADHVTTYEGARAYPTDGRKYPHPAQEAVAAERRLLEDAGAYFDEFVVLRFRATNEPPFPFGWVDAEGTDLDYGAALVRISHEYDARFVR